MSGLSTLMALSVRRSMRSSSSPLASSLAALAVSSGVRMVMYLRGEKTDGDATSYAAYLRTYTGWDKTARRQQDT